MADFVALTLCLAALTGFAGEAKGLEYDEESYQVKTGPYQVDLVVKTDMEVGMTGILSAKLVNPPKGPQPRMFVVILNLQGKEVGRIALSNLPRDKQARMFKFNNPNKYIFKLEVKK